MSMTTWKAVTAFLAVALVLPAGFNSPSATATNDRGLIQLLPVPESVTKSDALVAITDVKAKKVEKRIKKLREKRAEIARKRAIKAITTPTYGRLSARFGETSRYWSVRHTGIDFDASHGAPVKNVMKGKVIKAGWGGAYGYVVVVRTDRGGDIWYAHLSRIAIPVGKEIKSGKIIGYVGSTGNSTGSHLHLEVRKNDRPVNPAEFLYGKHKGDISKMQVPDWAYSDGIAQLDTL
jgi:murein DD-endopeptidase MepM/ murein hydrolase activator NlpD